MNGHLSLNSTSQIAKTSLANARSCFSNGNYGRAFANYLLFLKLVPGKRQSVLGDFILVMRNWTEKLEHENRIEDLFKCYDQACEIIPDCEVIMNNIGAQLFRLGYMEEAAMYIRRSLQISPEYLAAKENLENICSHLVERWHFRMLNDMHRNMSYRKAIRKAVQKGHTSVLDIGCGTGILSLLAMEAGATELYACEKSRTMCEIARNVLHANRSDDKVLLVSKSSLDLQIPDDIPERVSLVVTETFDAGLFGEHVIPTLRHAWQKLLISPPSQDISPLVIPGRATLYACAIECDGVRNQSRFLYPGLQNLDMGSIEIICSTGSTAEDPYTTENLSRVRGGFKMLSEAVTLAEVNFNDLKELEDISHGKQWDVCLSTVQSGRLDAIAVWFDLHLIEDITVTTSPTRENCWEQAVFPIIPSMLTCHNNSGQRQNLMLKVNEEVRAVFGLHDSCLRLQSISRKHDTTCTETEPESLNSPMQTSDVNEVTSGHHIMDRTDILRLNNLVSHRFFCQALEKAVLEIGSKARQISVLDYCTGLSPLLLQLYKTNVSKGMVVISSNLHDLYNQLAALNHIPSNMYELVDPADVKSISDRHDIIVCDLVESCGVLRQQILEDMALMRLTCASADGILVPGKVTVYGVCVDSEDLLQESCVIDDSRTCGFSIAKYINDFQMTTHVDVDMSILKHLQLSNPFQLLHFDLNEPANDSKAFTFLEQKSEVIVPVTETGPLTAVVYWFEFELYGGIKFSTLETQLPWKQAAVMIKSNDLDLISGQEIKIQTTLKNSCIGIKVDAT